MGLTKDCEVVTQVSFLLSFSNGEHATSAELLSIDVRSHISAGLLTVHVSD